MAYKQHIVEWFSGKQLPSYWINTLSGSASHGMSDEIDGGFKTTCPNTTHGGIELNFNATNNIAGAKRQYDLSSSTVIGVVKKTDLPTTGWLAVGCTDNINLGTDAANNYSCKYHQSVSAYVQGRSGDGTNTTDISSTLTMDTNFHAYKSESLGAKILYTMDGSLEITKSSNMPTGKGNPSMRVGMNTAHSGGSTAQIRYLEAYNT